MKIAAVIAGLLSVLVLAGCATLSKEQCQTGDWLSLGLADGLKGYPETRISEHQTACAEFGISVNRQLYEAGRSEGLKSYCTPNNAAEIGLAGKSYANVCKGSAGVSFSRVYRQANNVYAIEQQIELAQSQIESLSRQLAKPDLSAAERRRVLSDLLYNQGQLALLERQRRNEEAELRAVLIEETQRLGTN